MSAEITYLINPHKEGKIDDSVLNKALNALQPASVQTVESDVQTTALEKMRKRRRDKKKKRRKYAELQKSVINELKQVLKSRNSVSELKLIDKPLCNYFKTYKLDASAYKDAVLFADKKPIITSQIKHDIKEYNGIKFSVGLSIQFFHDGGN